MPSDAAAGNEKDAIQASIEKLSDAKNGSPSLIFVFADEAKEVKVEASKATKSKKVAPPPEPTQQSEDSQAAWNELFQKEGDYSIFIPGRFFNVIKVNASGIKNTEHKYLNGEKAPIVVLTRKNGEIQAIFEGKAHIKAPAVSKVMYDILKKDEYVKGTGPFAELNALMVELEKVEADLLLEKDELAKVKTRFSDAKSRATKAMSKAKGKDKEDKVPGYLESAEKSLQEQEKKVETVEENKNNVLRKEFALLKDMGLPAAKLPPEPPAAPTPPAAPNKKTDTAKAD